MGKEASRETIVGKTKNERDALVLNNDNMVWDCVHRLKIDGKDMDDILQSGREGLIVAANRYEPGHGVFSTYAYYYIKGYIIRYLESKVVKHNKVYSLDRVLNVGSADGSNITLLDLIDNTESGMINSNRNEYVESIEWKDMLMDFISTRDIKKSKSYARSVEMFKLIVDCALIGDSISQYKLAKLYGVKQQLVSRDMLKIRAEFSRYYKRYRDI